MLYIAITFSCSYVINLNGYLKQVRFKTQNNLFWPNAIAAKHIHKKIIRGRVACDLASRDGDGRGLRDTDHDDDVQHWDEVCADMHRYSKVLAQRFSYRCSGRSSCCCCTGLGKRRGADDGGCGVQDECPDGLHVERGVDEEVHEARHFSCQCDGSYYKVLCRQRGCD